MKKIMCMLLGLLALASCHDKDEATPATAEQMEKLTDHWYAEVPLSGETENWRTLEEGDMTTYDQIGAVLYLNGTETDACFWGYLYLHDGDMVNFDGLFRRDEEANFTIAMDSDGNITTSSSLSEAPEVTGMHYDNQTDLITADISHKGQTFHLSFRRVNPDQEGALKEFWNILAEEGIVGGYSDDGSQLHTDVGGDNASEPSRARQNP